MLNHDNAIHSNSNQLQVNKSSCLQKRADSTFLSVCYTIITASAANYEDLSIWFYVSQRKHLITFTLPRWIAVDGMDLAGGQIEEKKKIQDVITWKIVVV